MADDLSVTCRRWNWRQGRRTQITDSTTRAFFVFDRLDGLTLDGLHAAEDEWSVAGVRPLTRQPPDPAGADPLMRKNPYYLLDEVERSAG